MHVLLTRNIEDSIDLIQKLKFNSIKVSNLPLLEVKKENYNLINFYSILNFICQTRFQNSIRY